MIKAKLTGTSGAINSQLDSNEQHLEASLEKSTTQYVGGNGINIDNGIVSNTGVTSINGQTGDLDGFALTAEIPTKTSQLENDSNYANVNQIPTKTSQLVNDSNYATSDEIPTDYYTQEEVNTLISNVTVDLSDYYTKTESDNNFADKSDVPTKTSQLTNDSQFITNTVSNLTNYYKKTETYTQTEVNNLIGSMSSISFQVVDNLPSTGVVNIIYLVPDTQSTNNVYDEYIWINNSWELIGSTSVDLSNYYTKTEADNKFALSANLADVATSGSYNDLSNAPTIPTKISDLTNDSNFATTSDIPTKTSELTNDSGFITAEDIPSDTVLSVNNKTGNVILSASDVGALPDTTTIPTTTSQLTNDSGYITNATDGLTNYYNKTEVDNKVSSVYKYKGTVASYDLLPTTGQVVGDVYNVLDGDMNYAWTGESWDALGSSIDLTDYYTKTETDSTFVKYTKNENISYAGKEAQTTYTYAQSPMVVSNGIIISGTAENAGLVTRGICGVSTPTNTGACSKDYLYINYDGTNTYNTRRQLILQAFDAGTSYGSNLYQYAVPRGDIVKNWVESQEYAKATDLPTKTSDLTNDSEYQTATQVTAAINSAIGTTSNLLGDTEDLS